MRDKCCQVQCQRKEQKWTWQVTLTHFDCRIEMVFSCSFVFLVEACGESFHMLQSGGWMRRGLNMEGFWCHYTMPRCHLFHKQFLPVNKVPSWKLRFGKPTCRRFSWEKQGFSTSVCNPRHRPNRPNPWDGACQCQELKERLPNLNTV